MAYQTSAEPAKVAQADNTFAKTSGATVDWRKFDSGASVVRALASGDVQIGNIGSSPLAVAASQQVPIEVFLLASKLGNSEALVVKKSITKPEDLIGKRISTELEQIMEDRGIYRAVPSERSVFVTESLDRYCATIAAPIISEGDALGLVVFIGTEGESAAGETEYKLAQAIAGFLGKHMES